MKKMIFALLAIFLLSSVASAIEYVSGYQKSNGTYVSGYYRSSHDEPFTIKGELKEL